MPDDVIDAPADAGNPSDAQENKDGGDDKLLADGGGEDKSAPADWPEDWRTRLAGDDKDALKSLDRYKSPNEVAKALREAQKKISSGQMKPTLSKDATEEDIAAYRKEIGVPEKSDDYLAALPNGLVIGEEDKDSVKSFLDSAHAANMPPEHVGAALDWYNKLKDQTAADMAVADKSFRAATQDELNGEWGAEFRANINSVKSFLDSAPMVDEENKVSLGDMLRGARTPDGQLLGDHPAFLRWVANLANDANPAGFVAPAGGGSQVESVNTEIAEIEALMRKNRPAYDKDDKKQARYLQLLSAREKLSSR